MTQNVINKYKCDCRSKFLYELYILTGQRWLSYTETTHLNKTTTRDIPLHLVWQSLKLWTFSPKPLASLLFHHSGLPLICKCFKFYSLSICESLKASQVYSEMVSLFGKKKESYMYYESTVSTIVYEWIPKLNWWYQSCNLA